MDLQKAEYEALRATIRERGTARMWIILLGLTGWGALSVALAGLGDAQRAVTLVPFFILTATFEVSFFIHVGVERVGRYLQVYYEDQWEAAAMNYGQRFPGGSDPLFVRLFTLVAIVNFLIAVAAAAPRYGWIGVALVAHVILGWRFVAARRFSIGQRAADLEKYRALKHPPTSN